MYTNRDKSEDKLVRFSSEIVYNNIYDLYHK